jgi:hypothetical protein
MTAAKKIAWKHMADGEWAQCRKCAAKGYGIDSFHPFTREFFPLRGDKLRTDNCHACLSEMHAQTHGIVPERKAA